MRRPRSALSAALCATALGLAAACTPPAPRDCVEGLEGQLRCAADAATSWVEACLDGDWVRIQACDAPSGYACTTCARADAGGVPHACLPCAGGANTAATCALTAPVLSCP